MKTIERQIIKKLEEIIRMYQFPTKIKSYQGIVENTEKYIELSNELASLKSQLKESQCHAIYEKVKEANTPDKRSFEEAEAESQLKDAGQVRSAEETWDWLFDEALRALKHNDIENAIHWVSRAKEEFASQFQEQPITVTDDVKELLQHYEIYKSINSLDNCGRTYEDIIDQYLTEFPVSKYPLSLKAQKAQPGDEDIEKWAKETMPNYIDFGKTIQWTSQEVYDLIRTAKIKAATAVRNGLIPAKDKE